MNFTKTIINSIKFWVNKKLEKKVDIEEGKMLSSNDYTTEEKEKLASIEAGATKTSVNGMTGDVVIEIPTLDSLGAQPAGDYAFKTDILSPDLSQTDETAADYVKGVIRQESLPEGYPYTETVIDPIVWDGSEREVFFTLDDTFYKISDNVLTVDELIGVSVTLNIAVDAPIATVTLTEDDISLFENCIIGPDFLFVVVPENGITIYDITIPESGVYFKSGRPYVSDLRKENIKTIKGTFLPRASYYDAGAVNLQDICNTMVRNVAITIGSTSYDDLSEYNGIPFCNLSCNNARYFVYEYSVYTGPDGHAGYFYAINQNTNSPCILSCVFDSNGVVSGINVDTGFTLISPSGKAFKITVDDNGTLTVAEVV